MHEQPPPKRRFFYPGLEDLTIVLRSGGERTEESCARILSGQLPEPEQLSIVREKPFSRAVVRTFEIGIDSQRPWLIAIDADIIPLADVLERAREICGKMAPNAFCATPLFLCKAVGGFVMRGLHCYPSKLLAEALSLTPELPDDLRPESRYHDAMRARGYTREVYAKALGLHEYEQSYRHIYLKSLLRARKDESADQIVDRLKHLSETSDDARAALWGFLDSAEQSLGPTEYDWDAPLPAFEKRFADAGMTEKTAIDASGLTEMAQDAILSHPFKSDTNTAPWIREMHRFDDGAPGLIDQVRSAPLFSNPAPALRGAS